MSVIPSPWTKMAGEKMSRRPRSRWRAAVAWMTSLLKRGDDGGLLHGASGELVYACGTSGGCGCGSTDYACGNCPDATPLQFHVTFLGVTPCVTCTGCDEAGAGVMLPACTIDGTYVLTQNGDCAWTALASVVPCTGQLYFSPTCDGDYQPLSFAIQLVRVSSTQFELQITDDSDQILIFNATVNAASCCSPDAMMISNQSTGCNCDTSGEALIICVGTGGTATVTPC